MDIALFDFDGTITDCDTFTAFVKKAIPRKRLRVGRLLLGPLILGHRYGLVSSSYLRQKIVHVGFKGLKLQEIDEIGRQHAEKFIPKVLRPEAVERLKWHQERGDRILIVSASLNVYLEPWCENMGYELCCAELEHNNGLLTGLYVKGDCSGIKKVERIREVVDLGEYEHVYAYGDTEEDIEMLNLADYKYFRFQQGRAHGN